MVDDKAELEQLNRKLADARARHEPEKEDDSPRASMGKAFEVGAEMVGGVVVGAFLGWWLDKWLGTLPLFFILCMLLGIAGAGLTIYRLIEKDALQPRADADDSAQDNQNRG